MPEPKKPPKGKGKVLGMPVWAAALAIGLGLVVGFILLKRQGSGEGGNQAASDSGFPKKDEQSSGGGGGLGLADLPSLGVTTASLGVSTGAQNSGQTFSTGDASTGFTSTSLASQATGAGLLQPSASSPLNPSSPYNPNAVISATGGVSAPAPAPTVSPNQVKQFLH